MIERFSARSGILLAALLLGACASAPNSPTAAPAAKAENVPIENAGFEAPPVPRQRAPDGWHISQHAGEPSYRFELDAAEKHSGTASMRIDNIGPEPWGALLQNVNVAPPAGKIARVTAWMKTRDANGEGAALTVRTVQGGYSLDNVYMKENPVKGTTPWTRYTIDLPMRAGADRMEIGVMLQGPGSVWIDDVELSFVAP